jgi:hypothetical protein
MKLLNQMKANCGGGGVSFKYQTRGFQEPVIAHLVFNLTSKVNRKWGYYT